MGLLDSDHSEDPRSRARRYAFSGLALVLLLAASGWYLFRFHAEKKAVALFFDALSAGDTQRAYQLWKPQPSYTYQDFLEDWGPSGYYGPVKSYRIVAAETAAKEGSGVIVVVELSPYQPFPDDSDAAKSRRSREVRLWVERKDKSLGFPP